MAAAPPDYCTISSLDPPKYSDIVANRPLSPPPPYADPTGPSATSRPSQTQPSLVPKKAQDIKQYIGSCCALTCILFLIVLALLHLVLFGVCFKCSLPKTSLAGTRAFFFLHIIFLTGMVVYCYNKCKSRTTFTLKECLMAIFLYSVIPLTLNVVMFMFLTVDDMTGLNIAIQRPLSETNTYPCSLSFYKLIFGLIICNYIIGPVYVVLLVTVSICIKYHSHPIFRQDRSRNMQVGVEIQP